MDWDIDLPKMLIAPAILGMALFFLSLQLQGMAFEPNVSQEFIRFYQSLANLALQGLLLSIVFIVYRELRIGEILDLGFLEKAVIFFGFIIFIIVLTIGAGQILPVPKSSVQALQLSPEMEIYSASVIPAFTEDPAYLIYLPMFIMFITVALLELVGIELDRTMVLAVMVIACLIASTGFNIWFIPGFTSAHVPAYGEFQEAYIGAWIFGFGQSMTYMLTGWLIPVAHVVHNALIAGGQLYGVSVGQLQVLG